MKILVTTDFSENSKAGICYAISLADIRKAELHFLHSCFLPKPATMADEHYPIYAKEENIKIKNKLSEFVEAIYKSMKISPGKYRCVVVEGMIPETSITEYATDNSIDFICISTRGAGKLNKIFGTTAGNLITKSDTPVIAIPRHYKPKTIENVLYASDLKNYQQELNIVMDFVNPLNATVELFHLTYPGEAELDKDMLNQKLKKQFGDKVKLHLENTDLGKSLAHGLQNAIDISDPELVIMFTEQRRSFFQKLFLSSTSEQIVFQTKVPMLVYNKTAK
jgi:nucleotide-binding universal stress UspA family protein